MLTTHDDDGCCRECRQTLITVINSASQPSLSSASPSLCAVSVLAAERARSRSLPTQLHASFPVLPGQRIRPFTRLRALHESVLCLKWKLRRGSKNRVRCHRRVCLSVSHFPSGSFLPLSFSFPSPPQARLPWMKMRPSSSSR